MSCKLTKRLEKRPVDTRHMYPFPKKRSKEECSNSKEAGRREEEEKGKGA